MFTSNVGSCDALQDPFDFQTAADVMRAVTLLGDYECAADPAYLLCELAAASSCATAECDRSPIVRAENATVCTDPDDTTWLGSLDYDGSLLVVSATAESFVSDHTGPSGSLLVNLDGTYSRNISGYGVGNPPFYSSIDMDYSVAATGDREGWRECPTGHFRLAMEKASYSEPAVGYFHQVSDSGGPPGDFCFEARYPGFRFVSDSHLWGMQQARAEINETTGCWDTWIDGVAAGSVCD